MTNYDYRTVDGYEVHPTEIAEKLIELAGLEVSSEEIEIATEQLENALYYLDTVCQNEFNYDHFRTLYNVLAHITEND